MKSAMKELVFAKIETEIGTDAVPTVTNAIRVSNVTHGPLVADVKQRNRAMPVWGQDPQVLAQQRRTLSFDFEMAGSGAAGVAPAWGVIMRACAHLETIVADTSVAYTPKTESAANIERATFYYYLDGLRHKLLGGGGTITANVQGGDLPTFHADITGYYEPITDTAFPAGWKAVLDSFVDSIECNDVNTQFSMFGLDPVLETFAFTQGNTVAFARRANRAGTDVTNRVSSGTVTIETPTVADFDFAGAAAAGTVDAMQMIHGTVAGNIVQFDGPTTQLLQPTYSKRGDVSLVQLPLGFVRGDAGDDEYSWTVK